MAFMLPEEFFMFPEGFFENDGGDQEPPEPECDCGYETNRDVMFEHAKWCNTRKGEANGRS